MLDKNKAVHTSMADASFSTRMSWWRSNAWATS